MTDHSERNRIDKALTALILILGPLFSLIGWMLFGSYIQGGIILYTLISIVMIFLFAIWAWKGRPDWPYLV